MSRNNSCVWIILLIILIFCCGGNGFSICGGRDYGGFGRGFGGCCGDGCCD